MPKERSINPAQAQHKADKAKAIKKGKAEATTRRTEKLARKNPERLQKQLDDLKSIEASAGGKLTAHEKTILESLERDIKAVRKAREVLGDAAPKLGRGGGNGDRDGDRNGRGGRGGRGGGVLGKRRRDGENKDESESEGSEIGEDVKRIPMPRDTPPPIPKNILDAWYQKRRERLGLQHQNRDQNQNNNRASGSGTNANSTPLGGNERIFGTGEDIPTRPLTTQPKPEAKIVYEAAPAIRDLRKEAVAFVPAAVRAKLDKLKAPGGLVEPEEADALEKAGYLGVRKSEGEGAFTSRTGGGGGKAVIMEEVDDEEG